MHHTIPSTTIRGAWSVWIGSGDHFGTKRSSSNVSIPIITKGRSDNFYLYDCNSCSQLARVILQWSPASLLTLFFLCWCTFRPSPLVLSTNFWLTLLHTENVATTCGAASDDRVGIMESPLANAQHVPLSTCVAASEERNGIMTTPDLMVFHPKWILY